MTLTICVYFRVYLAGSVGLLLILTADARSSFCTETKECLLCDLVCKNDDYEGTKNTRKKYTFLLPSYQASPYPATKLPPTQLPSFLLPSYQASPYPATNLSLKYFDSDFLECQMGAVCTFGTIPLLPLCKTSSFERSLSILNNTKTFSTRDAQYIGKHIGIGRN
uniref:Uncharacterized protein n=1 Tax=Oncorhynchus tshawytscha TaxID=74940 RepID=A0AAZ3Q4Z5_ONCTS